jgi:hypothetical protein
VTTLARSITATDQTIPVAGTVASFPAVPFYLEIDNESI